jgi:large subunit ribosomal protein L22
MPKWGYSFTETEPEIMVKASGRDLKISPKAAREICGALREMSLEGARQFLQDVIDKKRSVPYRRYNKKVSHKADLKGWYAGRYPVKAALEILKIVNGLEANAEDKGLYVENMKIIHAAAQRARFVKRYLPRAFGRSSPKFNQLCHVELIAKESK